jgi:hypothetical protein
MRRNRRFLTVMMVVSAATIGLIAAASGTASSRHSAASGPSGVVGKGGTMIGKGGGFGESYKAPSTTLAHALFHARLLPTNKTARNITLAALGRLDEDRQLHARAQVLEEQRL